MPKACLCRIRQKRSAEALAGGEFPFLKQKGLEDAVSKISEEIRSEYLVSYKPSNIEDGGFHEIVVSVERPDAVVKTRPWILDSRRPRPVTAR